MVAAYFNTPFYQANPSFQAEILTLAVRRDQLKLEDYPEALRAALDSSEYKGLGLLQEVQVSYVGKLIAAKREHEALLESKRFLGITSLDGQALSKTVSTIGSVLVLTAVID